MKNSLDLYTADDYHTSNFSKSSFNVIHKFLETPTLSKTMYNKMKQILPQAD